MPTKVSPADCRLIAAIICLSACAGSARPPSAPSDADVGPSDAGVAPTTNEFGTEADYPALTYLEVVVAGDFNGDGKPDLAVAGPGKPALSVKMNQGDGTFGPSVDYPGTGGGYGAAVGDFDGDGHPDLALTNYGANTISVFLNKADGTLGLPVDYRTGIAPNPIAAADLNGDGLLDLAVGNDGTFENPGHTVSILLNAGGGLFASQVVYALAAASTPSSEYGTGEMPSSIAAGDLDGDGDIDLAVSNNWSDSVSVLFNQGSGALGRRADLPVGPRPTAVAMGDLNADGRLDLVVCDSGNGPNDGDAVGLLLNKGGGQFATPLYFETGIFPYALTIGDFNGDALPDIVVANAKDQLANGKHGTVSLLINSGNNQLAASKFPTGNPGTDPFSVAQGDFDGDGRLDFAVANGNSVEASSVSVFLNGGR